MRGTVSLKDDGSWGVPTGNGSPPATGSPTDPVVDDPLDISRMSVAQVDGNGDAVGSDPVGLGGASGLSRRLAAERDTFGYGFTTPVTLDPDAKELAHVLDGDIVATVPVSGAPTVASRVPSPARPYGAGNRWRSNGPRAILTVIRSSPAC